MIELRSVQNSRLQEVRKSARAGRPLADGRIAAEGPHLLEDALDSAWGVEEIFATEEARVRFGRLLARTRVEATPVSERAMESLATTEHSQGLVTLLRPRRWTWDELFNEVPLVIVLDAIQDPGNAGTVIRSAEAFGATGVVFGEGSVRVANGKLLRAASGSLFRLPYVEGASAGEVIDQLRARDVRLYGLTANAGVEIGGADLRCRCALAVGNEGAGLSEQFLRAAQSIRIPTRRVESLNAGVASSIALFEAARQRERR